jgi:hypothetical protein
MGAREGDIVASCKGRSACEENVSSCLHTAPWLSNTRFSVKPVQSFGYASEKIFLIQHPLKWVDTGEFCVAAAA